MSKPFRRIAAVDCGTNSIRLLISDVLDGELLGDVHREMRVVRLGQGVDANGAFAPEAIDRTRTALRDYVGLMIEAGVDAVRMVATSAARDASNRDEFFEMTRHELGRVVSGAVAEVISGDEEARLSFSGAVGQLDSADGPFVVTDLGGGSTELVLGDSDGVKAAYSADIGSVRITERTLPSDPPTAAEIEAARAFAAERLAEAFGRVPVEGAKTWVGVAGTITTLAALALELPAYDPQQVHLSRFDLSTIEALCARVVGMNHAERAAHAVIHPGRVDVIGGGAVITTVLAEEFARRSAIDSLVVSEHDILDGIAMSILAR
ncbi:Ppx/GppA phosphatase family protein [Smaragdicoccus niigatensis]|uniref:Ppx/GppA phosphatase family protein n=1 Tax=Smaragdicoccus niigatensis TaxID=359359 RepID=UPI000377EC79|nr:Ppx/GppA phosphatase family protein [Smaragdicoccus niigatensis]